MWSGADPKRYKEYDANSDAASVAATDGDDDDERDSDSDTPTANVGHAIDGPGPYIFFCSADGILATLDGSDMAPVYFALKAAALEVWDSVAHVPKAERHDALEEYMHMVDRWYVHVPDGAAEAPAALDLARSWETVSAEERSDASRDGEEGGEQLGRWYEVDAQREQPGEGIPTLEVVLEGEGTWWIIGFRGADLEGRKAMSELAAYLSIDN